MKMRTAVLVLLLPLIVAASPLLKPASGVVALYQFDEMSGTTAMDGSGFNHHATLVNGPVWKAGIDGGAIHCVATNAFLEVPGGVEIDSTWTIQAWTRFPLDTSVQGWRTLVKNSESHHHVLVSASGELGVFLPTGFSGSGYNVNSLSGWHLLSAVASGESTTFYIDGAVVGASLAKETLPVVYIGNNAPAGQNWGVIDSLRILNVARTPAQIAIDANPDLMLPQGLGQARFDGTPLAVGDDAHGGFIATATVEGVSASTTLEIEIKPVGSPFDGATGLHYGVALADGTLSTTVDGINTGSYHWRARSVDPAFGSSDWVGFGLDPDLDGDSDITFSNEQPAASAPAQVDILTGLPAIAVTDAAGIRFVATATDVDDDGVILQVELRRRGEAFTGEPTATGSEVEAGATAGCDVAGLEPGQYKWAYRAIDSLGAVSSWTPYSANAADFEVVWIGSQGGAFCGQSASGGASGLLLLAVLALLRR